MGSRDLIPWLDKILRAALFIDRKYFPDGTSRLIFPELTVKMIFDGYKYALFRRLRPNCVIHELGSILFI